VLKLAGRSPHTIQLCEDVTPLSPSSALSQLCISLSPKRAVKSRRRLVHAHLEAHDWCSVWDRSRLRGQFYCILSYWTARLSKKNCLCLCIIDALEFLAEIAKTV
jgi:hypothetical protein